MELQILCAVFPVGLLQKFPYNQEFAYLTYGALGQHLTKGFWYSKENSWSNATKAKYEEKCKCIIKSFGDDLLENNVSF